MMDLMRLFKRKRKGPPERNFLEKPEGLKKYEFSVRNFIEKKWVKWSVILALIVFIGFFFSSQGKKRNVPKEQPPVDQRVLMSASAMERVIGASAKSKPSERVEKPVKSSVPKKQKLDSGIAVYVFKNEPERDARSLTRRKAELQLGLPSGTKIPALLQDRVFSFNVEAPVLARVAKDYTFQDR